VHALHMAQIWSVILLKKCQKFYKNSFVQSTD
jgi:hypothetical protein